MDAATGLPLLLALGLPLVDLEEIERSGRDPVMELADALASEHDTSGASSGSDSGLTGGTSGPATAGPKAADVPLSSGAAKGSGARSDSTSRTDDAAARAKGDPAREQGDSARELSQRDAGAGAGAGARAGTGASIGVEADRDTDLGALSDTVDVARAIVGMVSRNIAKVRS